jgi:hypothetical protein
MRIRKTRLTLIATIIFSVSHYLRLSDANKWQPKYRNVKKVSQKNGRFMVLYLIL